MFVWACILSERLYILPVAVQQPISGRMFVWACIAFRTSLYLTCCSATANERKNVCMGLYCFQNISISNLLQCNSQLEEECLYGLVLLSEHLYILPVAL